MVENLLFRVVESLGVYSHFCDTRESPPLYGVLVFGAGPFCCITEAVISHNPAFVCWYLQGNRILPGNPGKVRNGFRNHPRCLTPNGTPTSRSHQQVHVRIVKRGPVQTRTCEVYLQRSREPTWLLPKKQEFQNGTLASGNMDQNLRFAPPVSF